MPNLNKPSFFHMFVLYLLAKNSSKTKLFLNCNKISAIIVAPTRIATESTKIFCKIHIFG
jgi:hypothetical protein